MELVSMDRHNPAPEVITRAIDILESGGVLAYPTETLYGIGADARLEDSVARVRRIKGRPETEPVSVIAAHIQMAREWVEFSRLAERIAENFWPGPLTLVLPLRIPDRNYLIGAASGLAIRIPSLASARLLSAGLGAPITATSANLAGKENLLSAHEIEKHLQDKIDLILDGGRIEKSPGSTLLDLTTAPPKILRKGVIPESLILDYIKKAGN
jgi:L-threonylcarbamoyladenylate synthase